jgi:putative zinc finger protein
MDCREFRKKHLAFIDDTLPGIELVGMQRHLAECEACARRDTLVRRSLLLVRNLPDIQPAPDFAARLHAKLRALGPIDRSPPIQHGPGIGAAAVAAAAVVALGYLSATTLDRAPRELTLAPVVAMRPEPTPSPISSPAVVATLSTGMPIWQAVILAEQAPMHFANSEFELVSYGR